MNKWIRWRIAAVLLLVALFVAFALIRSLEGRDVGPFDVIGTWSIDGNPRYRWTFDQAGRFSFADGSTPDGSIAWGTYNFDAAGFQTMLDGVRIRTEPAPTTYQIDDPPLVNTGTYRSLRTGDGRLVVTSGGHRYKLVRISRSVSLSHTALMLKETALKATTRQGPE
jgi:hypothetical protein